MRGRKHLLLLTVLMLLERCQQKPQVSMLPKLIEIFSGDSFYLECDRAVEANWYFDGRYSSFTRTYRIAVANPTHSGKYECEINKERSDPFHINILEYEPSASLTIKTGHPVMQTGGSVILNLHNEDGLQGWRCWVFREGNVKKIVLTATSEKSLDFQPRKLNGTETTFWCNHNNKNIRSNQITVRTSAKAVSLEMYPLPAIAGESLTLRCLTWGTDLMSHAVFYKGNGRISEGPSDTYKIAQVTEAEGGRYKCHATFKYIANAAGPPYQVDSDVQDVLVQVPPMKAVLSEDMYCSCQDCPSNTQSHWYMMDEQSWKYVSTMAPEKSGIYACREVWDNGRSSLSNAVKYELQQTSSLPIVVISLITLFIVAVIIFIIWYKKRNTTGAVYEDMPMRFRDKVDDKGEPHYDTLDPEAQNRKRKEGDYEALKKEGMKEGVYHMLGTEGAAEAAGGYEALKKEGMKEGVYHMLGTEGAAEAAGGYEALKKEGMKEGVYHMLGTECAAEAAGAVGGH